MKHIVTLFLILLFAAHSSLWAASLEAHDAIAIVWHSPFEASFPTVSGQAWSAELSGSYHRLTQRARGVVPDGVWSHSRSSAGLSVSFHTNSPEITVRYGVTGRLAMVRMAATGVSGVDLYATDADGCIRWCAPDFSFGDTIVYRYAVTYEKCRKERGYNFTLSLKASWNSSAACAYASRRPKFMCAASFPAPTASTAGPVPMMPFRQPSLQ